MRLFNIVVDGENSRINGQPASCVQRSDVFFHLTYCVRNSDILMIGTDDLKFQTVQVDWTEWTATRSVSGFGECRSADELK